VIRSRDATTPDREHGHTGLASGSVRTTNIGSTIGIPSSSAQQAALHEQLADAGAGDDSDVVKAAKLLLDAIEADDPGAAKTAGIDVARIWASDIDIEGVKASDGATGVKARDVTATKIKIKDIEATGHGADRP